MKTYPAARLLTMLFVLLTSQTVTAQFSASGSQSGTISTTSTTQGFDWVNPGNISSADNVLATCSITGANKPSFHLDAKNWGFQTSTTGQPNYIPADATINGIEVYVKMKKSGIGSVKDNRIILLKAGAEAGTNKARGGTAWPVNATETRFGSSIDAWGTTWTAADFVNAGFGVRISARSKGSRDVQAEIDHIRIIIYFNQTYFYSKSSGNLELTATWGRNTDGTGTAPVAFSTNGQVFFLQNRVSAALTDALAISGTASKLVVGNGTTSTSFTVPAEFSYTGIVDVAAASTLILNNTAIPTLGSIADNTTVQYTAAGDQPVQEATYYNLTVSGSGVKLLQAGLTGITVINNVLSVASGSTLDNGSYQVQVYGAASGISNNGVATGTGRYVYALTDVNTSISGTGAYSNLEVDFTTTAAARTLTLSGATTITGTLYLTDGILSNGTMLTMNAGSRIFLNDGTLGASVSSSSGYDVTYGTFTGTSKSTSHELSGNLRHVTVEAGAAQTIVLNRDLVLSGDLLLSGGTLDPTTTPYHIMLAGNFTNNALLTYRNHTLTLNGSATQHISGTGAQYFFNLAMNGVAALLQVPVTVQNNLAL
ncbi:MAG TPA: hypothetical protein VFZ78_06985, partial [Flavisolibacter sp.]